MTSPKTGLSAVWPDDDSGELLKIGYYLQKTVIRSRKFLSGVIDPRNVDLELCCRIDTFIRYMAQIHSARHHSTWPWRLSHWRILSHLRAGHRWVDLKCCIHGVVVLPTRCADIESFEVLYCALLINVQVSIFSLAWTICCILLKRQMRMKSNWKW